MTYFGAERCGVRDTIHAALVHESHPPSALVPSEVHAWKSVQHRKLRKLLHVIRHRNGTDAVERHRGCGFTHIEHGNDARPVSRHADVGGGVEPDGGGFKQLFWNLIRLGIDPARLRFRQHLSDEMAHYAADCWDAEVLLSYGWMEITGIADRGCWDLSRHAEFSGQDLTHFKKFDEPVEMEVEKIKANHKLLGPRFKGQAKDIAAAMESADPKSVVDGKLIVNVNGEDIELTSDLFEVVTVREKIAGKRVIPHVIEPSHGLDRIFYSVLEHAYDFDEKEEYTVLHLKPEVAPIKVGVFPLMEKDGLDECARDIYEVLQSAGIESYYDGSGTIGKRYARMDEVGTPYCVTVDYETLEGDLKGTVTIRDRDSKAQKRVPAEKVGEIVRNLMCGADFEKL